MTKKRTVRYSIETDYGHLKRIHSLGFYYNPNRGHIMPRNLDATKLTQAKKTLEHCRKSWPKWKHKIVKTTSTVEVLNY